MPPKRNYWLFKSEETCYSIRDLAAEKMRTTFWDGVRNYQARNYLRDSVKLGDGVLFYHSNADPLVIAHRGFAGAENQQRKIAAPGSARRNQVAQFG